ncbi:hypothetical protein U9M48_013791, partial [Paspalum notatum var. saurae]
WRDRKITYPVLSILSNDILSVPVSTVSLESAFSIVSRVIDERRRWLGFGMVEMLSFIKDWEEADARMQHTAEDKAMVSHQGKLLSKAGRETLLKSTLSSQPIYHLTAFLEQKYLIKQINRLRRNFQWKGDELDSNSKGVCLINWTTTARPKTLGGLGVVDLVRFARALWLR